MAKERVTRICSIENCGRPQHGGGYCDSHYHRWKRHGDPLIEKFRFFDSVHADGFAEYFWAKVAITADDTRCWIWQGYFDGMGYGDIRVNRRHYHSHRLAWELVNGREQHVGLEILHSCDVKACVNPNHLREDTHKQNMQEAYDRGLTQRGADRYNTHLTDDMVREIRAHLANGKTGRWVAQIYNLGEMAISQIKHNKTWKHVT